MNDVRQYLKRVAIDTVLNIDTTHNTVSAKLAKDTARRNKQRELDKAFKATSETVYNSVCDFVVGEKSHEKLTIGIIKTLAKSPIVRKDGTADFSQTIPYLNIEKRGFQEPIVDDLKQEVFIELLELENKGLLSLSPAGNELIFSDYENEKGEKKNSILYLYRTIRNYMNRNVNRISLHEGLSIEAWTLKRQETEESAEAVAEAEKGGLAESLEKWETKLVSVRNFSAYVPTLDIDLETLANNYSVHDTFKRIKTEYPKQYDRIVAVFSLRITGKTLDNIAEELNISKDKVRYSISLLRECYTAYKEETPNNCVFINKEKYADFVQYLTDTAHKEENREFPSVPLSCGIFGIDDRKKAEERAETNLENMENGTKYHVYNTKRQTLDIILENGALWNRFELSNGAKKRLSKELPNI